MSQGSNKVESSVARNDALDPKETLRQTQSGKDLLSSREYNFSVSSDQTLRNTIAAMDLLKNAGE